MLLEAERWRGEMYIAGYAVECLLKTKLMQMFECHRLGELEDELRRRGVLPSDTTIFTHQLGVLLNLANATARMRRNRECWPLFNLVNRWVPAWRYTADQSNEHDANDFLIAVERVSQWIENNI